MATPRPLHIPEPKTYENMREHFIERLKERHNLAMSDDEYDRIVATDEYTFVCKKNRNNAVVYIMIEDRQIYCYYSFPYKTLTTALPVMSEDPDINLIKISYQQLMWPFVLKIYDMILRDMTSHSVTKFDNKKDAALYYFKHSPFANLLMDKFEHGKWRSEKIINTIDRIMNNDIPCLDMMFFKKEKETD